MTVEVELRGLADAAAYDVRVPAGLAGRVLALAHRRRRRRLRIGAASAVAVAGLAGSLGAFRTGATAYVDVVQPSAAMAPTVEVGERVTLNRRLEPVVGDVVSVRLPGSRTPSLSRVVGLGGDTVACPADADGRCAGVEVDGRAPTGYLAGLRTAPFDAVRVPTGTLFVLGDDRAVAVDSRTVGPVRADEVEAVAVAVDRGGRYEAIPGAPRHDPPGDSDLVDPTRPAPRSQVGQG